MRCRFFFGWSQIWVATPYVVFWLSSYGIDVMSQTYWKGVAFYFRYPWEVLKEGEEFPHGFKFVTDELDCNEQGLSLGRI